MAVVTKRFWMRALVLGALGALLVAGVVVAKGDPVAGTWHERDRGTSNMFWLVDDEADGLHQVTLYDDAVHPSICSGDQAVLAGFMRALDPNVWTGSLGNAWCPEGNPTFERRPDDGYGVPLPLPFSMVHMDETDTVFTTIGACGGPEVRGVDSMAGVVAELAGGAYPGPGDDCESHSGMTVLQESGVLCDVAWGGSEEFVSGTCDGTNARVDASGNLFLMLWGQLPDTGAWEADGAPVRYETGCLSNYLFLRDVGFDGDFLFGDAVRYFDRSGRFLEVCHYEAGDPADLSGLEGPWHRNNYDAGHEVLACMGEDDITCVYSDVPDDDRGWPGSDVTGEFTGVVIDPEECPDHMAEACSTAEVIANGTMVFSTGLVTDETMAVQADGSMQLSWDTPGNGPTPFVCPWFDTFERALSEPYECTFYGP